MSEKERTIALLDDARALMGAFTSNGWSSAIIRVGESQFAFSRDLALGGLDFQADQAVPSDRPVSAVVSDRVVAPHVGTVITVAEVGSVVCKGAWAASLAVLDEVIEVSSPADGTVLTVLALPGTLVEYGQLLLELTP